MRNLEGNKFGKLTVIKFDGYGSSNKTKWLCKCDCGNIKSIKTNSLTTGHTKSCGCERKNNAKKHGKRNTKLYSKWLNIKDRCNNKNNSHYKYYGKKGIKMCEEWANNFDAFDKWAKNNGYKEGLTIERIDNNKGYVPENCKWIKKEEQQKNKTSNIIIEINGIRKIAIEWAKEYNINQQTLYSRIRRGWTGEKLIEKKESEEN